MVRHVSGERSSNSEVTALSTNATTMPASSRLAVSSTPRDSATVRAMAPQAPMNAAAVTPTPPTQAKPLSDASTASKLTVTPSAAPEALPSR